MQYAATTRIYREEKDPKLKQIFMEMLLAQTIIAYTLGEKWWRGAADEIDSWVKGVKRDTPRTHPLSAFMTGGAERVVQPERWGQIVRLGSDLLTLLDQPASNQSLEGKLSELRSRSFFDTWFEISMAAIFIRKGMFATLIPESSKEKRPDIEVQGQFGKMFVECKARTRLSAEERSSDEVYRKKMKVRIGGVEELVKAALEKFPSPDSPSLAAVNIDILQTPAGSLELKLLRSSLELILIRNPNLSGVILLTERFDKDEGDGIIGFHGDLHILTSQNAVHSLPDSFFRLLIDPSVDTRPKMFYITNYALAH